MRLHPRIRRLARISGIVLGSLLGIVLILLCTLLLRPMRERALDEVLQVASGSLPGTLTVREADWPALSRLEFEGVDWRDGDLLLASFERLELDLDLRALTRKDIHVRTLVLEEVNADIPLISASFATEADADHTETDGSSPSFPRAGSLPWSPSIALDSLRVDITHLQIDSAMSLEGEVDLGVDLRAHHSPGFSLRSLRVTWPEQEWQVRSDELDAFIATGEFGGSIELDLGAKAALRLELSSTDNRIFNLSVTDLLSGDTPLLVVEGSFEQRPSGLVSSLEYRADLRTPDVARVEELLGRPGMLERVAPIGQITLHAEGDIDLSEPVRSHALVTATASDRDIQLEARIEQTGSAVELHESKIEAEGLSITARGRYDGGKYNATLQSDVAGVAFLEGLVDVSDLPADLRGRIELQLEGEGSRAEPDLRIFGAAPSAGLDSLEVSARGRVDGRDSDMRIAIRSLLREQVAVGIDARLLDLEAPRVHLAPVQIDHSLDRLDLAAIPDSPTLQIDLDSREIRIAGFRVTGTAGELSLDAQAATEAGGSGELRLDWPVLPAALELAGLDVAGLDSLMGPHWANDGTPGLEIRFTLDPGARSGEVDASLMFPAPWKLLTGLTPESYEAGPLLGALRGRWNDQGAWNADLDLAATAWLDSAFAHLRGVDGSIHLDSLLVRGGPARVTAAGSLDSTNIDGKMQLDLVPHPAIVSLVPDLPDDLAFLINLRAGVTGRVDAPDARAKLLASARSSAFSLPLLSVEGEVVQGIPQRGIVDILEPASVGDFSIDAAHIELAPEDPSEALFPLWASIGITGDVEWAQLARIDSLAGAWYVRTDSLRVGASGQSMRSLKPFELVVAPADSVIRFDGLDLAGDAGSITGSLDLAPGRARANLEIHLDASIPSALVQVPPQMLPTGYHLIMRGTEADLTSSLWVEGINLGARQGILAKLDAERAGNQLAIDIQAKDDLGVVASGDLVLPLSIDLLTREFQWHDGSLSGEVVVDSLPLPWRVGGGEGMSQFLLGARDESAPLLDARLLFGGTGKYPAAGARLSVGFPEIEELRDDRFELDAIWIGPGTAANSLGLFDDPATIQLLEETLPHGGVATLGSLKRAGQSIATVRAGFPLEENSTSPIPGFGKEDRIAFGISAEPLRLDDFSQVLPRGTDVGGNLWISARGDGPIGDLPLEASIRMEEVSFRQSFGSHGVVSGQIDVTGRSSAPTIRGKIKVSSAVVRLPESGRDLHPVKGESQLWALGLKPVDRFAALDTLEVNWGWSFSPVDSTEATEPALTLAESTELDVTIEIPNSFWIRGQGLEVQLAGDLRAELQNGVPRVVGELRAISGQLEVVGARLRLDRGLVNFYGGDTSNPGLDLELSRNQGDVKVMVRVTGTAQDPRLAFDSDPPMSQSDIMSYLLFGSSASDLDGAQTQLLQDQAAAALSQFAAPMLENELTQSLGITMMQLQAGENPDDGLSLVVGKYVTPQILVKYEQSLKDRQKYTVNAEYWLNRNFRIETRLSDSRSTGIQLNWSTDY